MLLAERNKRIDKTRYALWDDYRVERMRGAESVPQGKRRVVPAPRRMNRVICTAILSVDIGLYVRLYAEMVKSGVPVFLLLVRPLDELCAGKKRVPLGAALRANLGEGLAIDLGAHVLFSTIFRNSR